MKVNKKIDEIILSSSNLVLEKIIQSAKDQINRNTVIKNPNGSKFSKVIRGIYYAFLVKKYILITAGSKIRIKYDGKYGSGNLYCNRGNYIQSFIMDYANRWFIKCQKRN